MALAFTSGVGSGTGGTVTSVTATDASIVVTGTATAPTIATGTLDVIATTHPPAADWSNNSHKITSLANGAAASDAAAFGQIPTSLPPSGAAGGDLAGTYPNPTIGAGKVTTAKLASAVTLDAIATANATAADVNMNSHKITNLTNGAGAQDAAAFGQIPTALPPNGSAGGDLASTYPNPTVAAIHETSGPTKLTIGTIADGEFLKRVGSTLVSALAPVTSIFGRTGAVVAANGDYNGVVASALTGATQATRYVGATTSGAPASGTFAVGDFVVAQNGHIFVCTVAGTSGTWVDVGSVGNLVTSVFGRTGGVTATSGDYTAAQVTNAADKSSSSAQSFAGGILSTNVNAGIGYGAGAGASVTQTTNKSTGVTLNGVTGRVIMNNASLASNTQVKFVLTNSQIGSVDLLVVGLTSGYATAGTYRVEVLNLGTAGTPGGAATIAVTNLSAGSLSESLGICFSVIKTQVS